MKRTCLALILSSLPLGQACVMISTGGHEEVSGQYVSAETLAQIQPGSTQEYVMSLLDEPTTKTVLSDGTEIWKWTYSSTASSRSSLLFVLNAEKNTKRHHNSYIQFEGGLVTKAWRD
jgi:outer membrane protein assembly factor BamE (lipoprotein component of BamABCDE complex)